VAGITATLRFPIRFSGISRAMSVLGLRRLSCYVDVTPTVVDARMGWAFRATIDRRSIRAVEHDRDRVWGRGAHGWRGVWLINGSSDGIVGIELDPPGRARILGVGVVLRVLRVALEDPDGFRAALEPP
jgi:hypothetical protein